MAAPKGFKWNVANGVKWLWPDYDSKCGAVVFRMSKDLDDAMSFVRAAGNESPAVAVQAGGNCGVWPRALSPLFHTVYTFEPDPMNFACLAFNTMEQTNVIKFQAALGDKREFIRLGRADHEHDNCGAMFVEAGGNIPTMRVDDLQLFCCDLLYLDIEGYEHAALLGAHNTIQNCRPVIVIEDKGLSDKYGITMGESVKTLEDVHEYVVVKRVHKDVILAHASQL